LSGDRTIGIATERDGVVATRVRLATSFVARFVGLLDSGCIGADEGMLFRPGGSVHTLGMRTRIDVAFLDRDLRVLKLRPAVRPWRVAIAPRRTRYTLELAPGRLACAAIAVGQQLKIIDHFGEKRP
jgi:uncharacterized protein